MLPEIRYRNTAQIAIPRIVGRAHSHLLNERLHHDDAKQHFGFHSPRVRTILLGSLHDNSTGTLGVEPKYQPYLLVHLCGKIEYMEGALSFLLG